jgi:hypothetical protein
VVEMEGVITSNPIFVLIDRGYDLSYVFPQRV